MMKIVLLSFLLLLFFRVYTQVPAQIREGASNPFLSDVNGRPLYMVSHYTAEGSPYFADDYQAAQLTLVKGRVYNNVKVKINVLERIIQYRTADGAEMITDEPVKKLVFTHIPGMNGPIILESFSSPINLPGAPLYQVLDTGKIKLLKKIVITSRDEKKYGNAGTVRIFERKETWYSMDNSGEIRKLEKGKTAMLALFNAHRDALAAFIDQHQLGCRAEQDYKAIFRFCNGL